MDQNNILLSGNFNMILCYTYDIVFNRDGKRILAQGAEAFVLSRADAKKSSKKINSEVGNKSNKKQKVQHETSPIRQQEKTDIGKNSILAYTTVIK